MPRRWNSCTPAEAEFLDATFAAASLDAKMAKAGAMAGDSLEKCMKIQETLVLKAYSYSYP